MEIGWPMPEKPEIPELDALLVSVAGGDRHAFAELYDRAAPRLFGLVMLICRDRALAEDALQETFVEVWRKAARYDRGRGRASTWLAVIARGRAVDLMRERRRRGLGGGDGDGPGSEIAGGLVGATALESGAVELLTLIDCLARLDPRTREMVLMAYFEGLSRAELAARYAAPENTVKSWLRRGLAALRRCLEE